MFDTFVHVAFWLAFGIPAFGALLFLAGTILASDRLTTARHHFDRGDGDPASDRLYLLSMRSGTLSTCAFVSLIPLAAAGVAAAIGHTALSALGAIAMAALMMVVGDALRTRHERHERDFEAMTGEPIVETYHKIISLKAPDRPPAQLP